MLDKRYNPQEVEQGKYESWLKGGYFTAGDKTKNPFCMVIPPPNVTGKLHLGHAWDTTVIDIIARYKKAQGYDVLWVPGMDHAGIATQAKVMQKLNSIGIDTRKITREEFLKWAWEWKEEYGANIRKQWATLGLALDYTRERFTLDDKLNLAVRTVFVNLYNKGLIYQGTKIINWDPVQQTALSNIEVIHQDDEGYMYYFKYPIVGTDECLTVATTRPETMFGDVCVVVNPKDTQYTKYHGMKVINPANGDILPIIADEYVEIGFGTGAMKCTPAHDPNDFLLGKKYGFDMPIIFNKDATMNEKCGKYQGMDRFVCREALIEDIKKAGNFVKQEKIIHPVGHSERSDAVVEPMLSKQWFVKMRPLADMSIANQKTEGRVNFIPSRFEHTFIQWMEKCEDWCVSRQLWWGHRIPAYYHKVTGEVVVSVNPPKDIENYTQEEDVLDTWFSSGIWPFSTLGWPEQTDDLKRYFPTDTLSTGYDIIFFWVSRMIFQSLAANGVAPFKNVVIHGLIRDEQGRKMSKSLGNGVDPIDVINKYGADALRYFITSNSTPGQDTRYSDEKVSSGANYLNKIWNSARYVLSVLPEGFKADDIKSVKFGPLDQWIINKLERTIKNVTNNMEKYDFNSASSHLYNFVYDDFCSQYLEMSKVTLNGDNCKAKEATYQTLFYCLKSIIMLIYPYTPFISEEMYQNLPEHKKSIMSESYPIYDAKLVNNKVNAQIDLLFSMIKDVRNYKIENKIAPNAKLDLLINLKIKVFDEFNDYLNHFTFSTVEVINDIENKAGELKVYDHGELLIQSGNNAQEIIDKINKEIATEKAEIERCNKMLNNPNFVNKAPADKVNLEKEKLAQHEKNLISLEEKIKKLA